MITNALKEFNASLEKFTKIRVFEVVRNGQPMLSFRSNYGMWTHDEIPFDRDNITRLELATIVSRKIADITQNVIARGSMESVR